MFRFSLSLLAFFTLPQNEVKEHRSLHNSAETAFSQSDYLAAKQDYLQLLLKTEPFYRHGEDWQNYVDIVLRLSEIHMLLKEYKEGEDRLLQLLNYHPPEPFLPRILVALARLYSCQDQAENGYVKIRELAKNNSPENWAPQDRSFFRALEYSLNAYYESFLQKGKCQSTSGCYKEAILAYEKVWEAIEKGYFPAAIDDPLIKKRVKLLLAESYFQVANFEKTLELAEGEKGEDYIATTLLEDEIDAEMLSLAASVYKQKREYKVALAATAPVQEESSLHYEKALFEVAHFHFRRKNWEKAKEHLTHLVKMKGRGRSSLLGTLYLGRIFLQEKREGEALSLFKRVEKRLSSADPLYFEALYLQGEVHFQKRAYKVACALFEKSLLPSTTTKGGWTRSGLYKWALSYIYYAKTCDDRERAELFTKGEKILKSLCEGELSEKCIFALAELYLCQKEEEKLALLLSAAEPHLSDAGKLEALLFFTLINKEYETRETLFEELINEKNSRLPNYSKCWFCRAMHHLEEAHKNPEKREDLLEKTIVCLEKSFELYEKQSSLDGEWQMRTETFFKEQKLPFLDKLAGDEKELYIQALLLSKMEGQQERAEKLFRGILEKFPKGDLTDRTLFELAKLQLSSGAYVEALINFMLLGENHPHSPLAQETFFWAGVASEKRGDDPERIRMFNTLCYEKYPHSPKADEAYFRCYTLQDYMSGEKRALKHIQALPSHFPNSPFQARAYFIMGSHGATYAESKELLEKAIAGFEHHPDENASLFEFHERALLALAKASLRFSSHLEEAEELLIPLLNELHERQSPYSPLYEESEFALYELYAQLKMPSQAYAMLLSMLKHYDEEGKAEGHYLSKVWRELGKMAAEAQDFTTALLCYETSLECGSSLDPEEHSSLHFLKSDCYLSLNDYDKALLALAPILDNDTSATTQDRALFLSASLHEQQGHTQKALELLLRAAPHDTPWAHQARSKLGKMISLPK